MANIHPLACVDPAARIAGDAAVGPYCVIGPHVVIEDGARLIAHVHVTGHTLVGPRATIQPFASLGTPPQSTSYAGEPTRLVIGADCDIREGVTMNVGTVDGGGITRVGASCMFMANTHVGHDCHVGDHVTLANGALLGGHVTVGAHTFIGGNAAVHQFVRIGESAMIGGVCGVRGDVMPFGYAVGALARLAGLNVIGMKRRGMSREDMHAVRKAYRMLFAGDGVYAARLDAVAHEFAGRPAVARIVEFLRAAGKRPVIIPITRGRGDEAAPAPAD